MADFGRLIQLMGRAEWVKPFHAPLLVRTLETMEFDQQGLMKIIEGLKTQPSIQRELTRAFEVQLISELSHISLQNLMTLIKLGSDVIGESFYGLILD